MKVSFVIHAFHHCLLRLLFKHLAGSKLLWGFYPASPSTTVLFPPLTKNLSALNLLSSALVSALRASDVTKQLASGWRWHYVSESYTWVLCHISMIPVLRIDDKNHKEGRGNLCFWSQMGFRSHSSYCYIHLYQKHGWNCDFHTRSKGGKEIKTSDSSKPFKDKIKLQQNKKTFSQFTDVEKSPLTKEQEFYFFGIKY